MWKLKVYQRTYVSGWKSHHKIEFISDNIHELLCVMRNLATTKAPQKVWFKLEEVEEGEEECSLES